MISWIASALERPLVIEEPFQPLDAIIVLGAPLVRDRMSPVLEERVVAAAALYHAGGAPLVVATGGRTRGAGRAEADVIADELAARGVREVVRETRSRTTVENARFTATLVDARRIWLVTQPFHGRRAARVFRAAGFTPHVWHIADSLEYRDRTRAVRWLVREYAAWGREMLAELARR
jgi:uncharacterized SAM-binding protein YcdF (DUF218 family)